MQLMSNGVVATPSRLPGRLLHRIATLILMVFAVVVSVDPANCEENPNDGRVPNVILILVDDLGWSDLPCYGNNFHETPHIDRLARQGMRFQDFYAAPVCSPARASIQSGQYTARVGITNFIPGHWRPFAKLIEAPNGPFLPLACVTIAEALKQAGYTTGHFGKWHLGPHSHFPDKQGYDVSVVTGGRHFGSRVLGKPPKKLPPEVYLADFLTDRAVEFIEQNRDRPFFVHLAHYAVHIPLEAKAAEIRKYVEKPKPPGGVNNPVYAAMIAHVDQSVGRVMKTLEQLQLADNTVFIFTSDNGGLRRRYDGQGEVVTTNAPLRDEKGSLYEGGIRVPLVVRWPGVVAPDSVCREPVTCADFYPTLVEVAGGKPPAAQVLDGLSLVPLLKQAGGFQREAVYFHYPHYHHTRPAGAIRAGDWKLIEFFDDETLELYNLKDDLGEQNDLIGKLPQLARQLHGRLEAWRKSVGAKMPTENPKHDPQRAGQWWSRRTKKPLNLRKN